MPRSRRRQAKRRSASERTSTNSALPSNKDDQHSSSTSESRVTSPDSTVELNSSMADRYYAMAETMNSRGAMEMAVPFYRQAIALLLADRTSLREKLGGDSAQPVADELPMDELHGLIEAAEALGESSFNSAVTSMDVTAKAATATATGAVIEDQIAELASELGKENAMQVIAGLKALADGVQLPASGLALLGKAQMLLGKTADGLKSFEAASTAAPGDRELQINIGAARLANGDDQGALVLLRGVWQQGIGGLQFSSQQALLRNLATAEAKAGSLEAALQLRLKWFNLRPDAVSLQRWLTWAQEGLDGTDKDSPERMAALALLKSLQQSLPQDRNLQQRLADALEDQGDYRDAALLYRQLLRPQLG